MPVRKASFGFCVAVISSTFYFILHYVTNTINKAVDRPYMDEIFHIPQAQRYCQHNFSYYDPKLTTPPGLYLLTYARIWFRDRILLQKAQIICDTIDLRRTNHLVAIFNFITLVLIQISSGNNRLSLTRRCGFGERLGYAMRHLSVKDLFKILLTGVAITMLPPLFFFNSLYYTDAGSLLFTLIAYLLSINDHHYLASLFGMVAITFRQTNVVWIFYFACLVILNTFQEHYKEKQNSPTNIKKSIHRYHVLTDKKLILKLIIRCLPYALVGLTFVIFVIINKGIVLGDKEAHQPKLHSAQILYFLGFCSFFGPTWMLHLRILRRFLYFTIRSPILAVIASAFIIYLIAFGRYAHPYLLADNRHITFYIWRRILDRHNSYVPFMMTPIYLVSSFSLWHHLRSFGSKQMILFILSTILVTVPNGLLELRYFIIPFVLLRLSVQCGIRGLLTEILQHLVTNICMHYLFIHKTFHWTDSPEIQRIMW